MQILKSIISTLLVMFVTSYGGYGQNVAYAPVNGIKMYYEIHGAGKPLVLIHGGGSTITTTFGNILPLLAKTHLVIAVELQAHGHTSDRNAPESFEQDADDVAELLKQLNIGAADIFGFSNVGNTTMKLAIRHPERVRRLIIASSFYKRDGMYSWFWDNFNHAKLSDMPQDLKDAFLKINNSQDALLNMFNKDAQRMQTFKDWNDEDLKSIKAPALVVIGNQDIIRPEHAVAMYRLLPHGHIAILPGNHGSYMGADTPPNDSSKVPELFVEMVDEFLGSVALENK
jgi:pimeloyl-ACP methyl ester carboxylesterase